MSSTDSNIPVEETSVKNLTSPWSPFQIRVFRNIWLAGLISNIGTWMHDVGAGWLMTSLTASPVMVAMIQTATALPIFFLAIPAGALADIFDRRHYLIAVQIWMLVTAGLLGILTLLGLINEWLLLLFTFCLGVGSAMMIPAWSSITPEIVPKHELKKAIPLNAMGVNLSRAIGPALAGVIIAMAGSGAVFIINSMTFLVVIIILVTWKRPSMTNNLPAERFISAIGTGLRFVKHAPAIHAVLIRSLGFFTFASALWALLPLIARQLIGGGPQTFGILVTSVGAGAVVGALILPKFRTRFNSDQLIIGATILVAIALTILAYIHLMIIAVLALSLFGIAWITVVSSLQVAAQLALPDWVRSRGLAVFLTTFMGIMAVSSIMWGNVAKQTDIPTTMVLAAFGGVVAILFTWRWSVTVNEESDLTPSGHWTLPETRMEITHDRSPVMIFISYHVRPGTEAEFLQAMQQLGLSRRRDGAYSWDVMEDAVHPGWYIEYYMVTSWLEHLRQHERVTKSDKQIQEKILGFLEQGTKPKVRHYVGPTKIVHIDQ